MKASPIFAIALMMMTSLTIQADSNDTPIIIVPAEPAPGVEIRTMEAMKLSQNSVIDLFSVLDDNDDDQLSRHEISDRPALHRYFHKLDTNSDGLLNREEFASLGMGQGFHFGPGRNRIHSV